MSSIEKRLTYILHKCFIGIVPRASELSRTFLVARPGFALYCCRFCCETYSRKLLADARTANSCFDYTWFLEPAYSGDWGEANNLVVEEATAALVAVWRFALRADLRLRSER